MADIFKSEPAILKVSQMGNPVLRKRAEPLTQEEIADPRTAYFIDSLITTMRENSGAGLAAPQVHVSKQLAVVEAIDNERYPSKGDVPFTLLVNPKITAFSEETEEDWEGCISVKGIWGIVRRSVAVTVEALDRKGKEVRIDAEGFYARVLQHEIDHLYGKLFVDRMENMSSLCFSEELKFHRE